MRPLLLDAFCCQGGAAMGYHRAGFDVLGVDIEPQPRYPFPMVQADALEALASWDLSRFAAIHASPPCQAFTTMSNRWRGKESLADQRLDLLTPVRAILPRTGIPYVIENVQGAATSMASTLILHGGMFGLRVDRPRYFESNVLILVARSSRTDNPVGVYGDRPDGRRLNDRADGSVQRAARSLEEAQEVMGMPWADWHGCKEAVPPAYTEFIGQQLLEHLATSRVADAVGLPAHG
jgi:DNA (cytosine-5)-methyltransferase 1